jgi:hypothetical protein
MTPAARYSTAEMSLVRSHPTVRAEENNATEPNVTVARSGRGCGRSLGQKGLVSMSSNRGMTDPTNSTIQRR